MTSTPKIIKTKLREWENRHLTFRQPVEGVYELWNADTGNPLADYNAMTAAIQQFIRETAEAGACVRALGSGWSWTRVAATEGRMLQTQALNLRFDVPPESVSPRYKGSQPHLHFVQCGNSVKELNAFLERRNQCLCTSGASNGQTIAGALSTGTHGSAFDFGAIPEFVVGLHLITGPERHVWLERASYPVIADGLAERLGAELIRDDDLFNAALVSFGSFGFIHGVMLETEDLYLLESHRQRFPLDAALRNLMETLDFSQMKGLPHDGERPFHLQILLNPHDLKRGVYVSTMYKRPYRPDYERKVFSDKGHAPGDDAPAFLGGLTDTLPALVPLLARILVRGQYKMHANILGTPGETFSNSTVHGKIFSTAMGFRLDNVNDATDLLLSLHRSEGPFNGVFAYRFVKSSTATMGFTHFKPVTCILELDGVYSRRNLRFCEAVWEALDRERIPYTFHWGKICGMNPERLKAGYGVRPEAWAAARNKLLSPECLKVFENRQIAEWGLCREMAAPFVPIPA